MIEGAFPFFFAPAESNPQRSATSSSIANTLPRKRSRSSVSSQVSRRVLRLLCGMLANPFRISPKVSTLRYSTLSSAASIQANTLACGEGRTSSEIQFVSRRNPFIARDRALCLCPFPDRVQLPQEETRGKIAQGLLVDETCQLVFCPINNWS